VLNEFLTRAETVGDSADGRSAGNTTGTDE